MAKDSQPVIRQSGVVPYRIKRGRVEVALVTASSGPHWTIPKGHIEPEMTARDSAAKEAFEESGLIGRVERRCLGTYMYEKRGRMREVRVYPLAVRSQLRRWPEREVRNREWMSVHVAASRVRNPELRDCIHRLGQSIRTLLRQAA